MSNISYNIVASNVLVYPGHRDIHSTVIFNANDKQFHIFLPTFTVICILMIIGIPGNILTLLVYTRRLKKAIARQFLMTLATCDLLTCSVVMPTELVIMTHFFDWDIRWLCKSFRWFSYTVNNISSLTLLIIAVERYRLVCKPWKQKFTAETSRYLCYINIVFSVITALPMFFMYGTQTIPLFKVQNEVIDNLTNSSTEGVAMVIYGKSCLMDDAMTQLAFPFAVVTTSVYIISIIIVFIAFIFLYGHVVKTLVKRRKESLCQQEGKSKEASACRIRKITFMMIILTVLYEICYLPCLSVVCLRLTRPEFYTTLSSAGKTVFQLLLKSYLLCSAFNPFVYCFCNKEFLAGLFWILRSIFPATGRRQSILQSQKLVTVSQSKDGDKNGMVSRAKTMETEDLR
ncbi:cholecystokinin receptor type A-like [Mercenaria mercenaria]|uniref:cholecystokinin receptor type A-like n=1 Tax=Mercenaria mercenaria TaxID=6596 RepID=UPI00234FA765|nr:cholecystokinin receptor type A-like [Mercenaria mercenaria]XP_045189129.2 cholecystokinin receptor type A-like [Mercenaria mercenaria]XP_045189130.2 cholecystokinin receptor type A-like [Mercenaria mercenaria]XP_053406992.1 cholecystokinin receptor type A-like [Mercenaria mercenaria]